MIGELAGSYGVRDIFAVLKNSTFVRSLERLGFAPASPEHRVAQQVEPGEVLFFRTCLGS
jgi:hypothetical protein